MALIVATLYARQGYSSRTLPACLQKWSKGKMKDKANNMVLFDQVRPPPSIA